MTRHEMGLLIGNADRAHRQQWEMTRQSLYMTAQVNSKRRLRPRDVMGFPWDGEADAAAAARANRSASNAEKERLRALAERMK